MVAEGTEDPKGEILSREEVLAMVPQQEPFRFIDEIVELDEEHIVARYTFTPGGRLLPRPFPGQSDHAGRDPDRNRWPRRASWRLGSTFMLGTRRGKRSTS